MSGWIEVHGNPLLAVLRSPDRAMHRSAACWETILWHARKTRLGGCLWHRLGQADLADHVPEPIARRLEATYIEAEHSRRAMLWEVDRLERIFRGSATPFVLLKGAAYAASGFDLALGRPAGDTDVMVPADMIAATERVLLSNGWEHVVENEYDQQYYRRWMHELPPLRHRVRETTLDLHHAIVPPSSRLRPDMGKIFEAAIVIDGRGTRVLASADMLLHCAVHLFYAGEVRGALRDLVDFDGLVRQFRADTSVWESLVTRATSLGLLRPLFYALRYAHRLLETPIPLSVIQTAEKGGPIRPIRAIMDAVVPRALIPPVDARGRRAARTSGFGLYLRSHWLRMSPARLSLHIARKSVRRWTDRNDAA